MLPVNESTFQLAEDDGSPVIGSTTGKKYEGSFTVRCILTNSQSVQAAITAERYNGGEANLPQYWKLFNRALAESEARILPDKAKKGRPMAPAWWIDSDGGREIEDQNVVFSVYSLCMKAEKAWKDSLTAAAAKSEASPAPAKDPAAPTQG